MVKYSRKPEVYFSALSHRTRRKMVETLAERGELSVSQLKRPFSISLPAALKHVHVLEDSGLVACSKRGRVQYCKVNAQALEQMTNWLMTQRMFWERSFDRLERHLANIKKTNKHK